MDGDLRSREPPGAPIEAEIRGRIEAVTLSTPDLELISATYRDALEQVRLARGTVDTELAASWGTPGTVGRAYELLAAPVGVDRCILRWVESEPPPRDQNPRTTWGWAALELTVGSADALYDRLSGDGRFRVIAPPAALPGLPQIYPMQAEGPAGEVLYLNEVRGDLPDHDLPRAGCAVDRVFIAVLGVPDLDTATGFYTGPPAHPYGGLGFSLADEYEIPYRVINDAFQLPETTRHRLRTTCVGRRIHVEIDQYPPQAGPRSTLPGQLPPAMAMVSFAVPDLEPHLPRALGPVIQRDEPPYRGRRALAVRGRAGELVELIESSGSSSPEQNRVRCPDPSEMVRRIDLSYH